MRVLSALLCACASFASADDDTTFLVGVAKRDITGTSRVAFFFKKQENKTKTKTYCPIHVLAHMRDGSHSESHCCTHIATTADRCHLSHRLTRDILVQDPWSSSRAWATRKALKSWRGCISGASTPDVTHSGCLKK